MEPTTDIQLPAGTYSGHLSVPGDVAVRGAQAAVRHRIARIEEGSASGIHVQPAGRDTVFRANVVNDA